MKQAFSRQFDQSVTFVTCYLPGVSTRTLGAHVYNVYVYIIMYYISPMQENSRKVTSNKSNKSNKKLTSCFSASLYST